MLQRTSLTRRPGFPLQASALPCAASALFAVLLPVAVAHAEAGPVGLWKTIDDATKQPKALVRVSESEGVLTGRIEKVLALDEPDPMCAKCPDERKGKPAVGLTIIRSVRKSGEDANLWEGGDILDPENGMVYKVRLKPTEEGRKLEVRGYLFAPLIGRTQLWQRVE